VPSVWYFAYGSNMQSATFRGRRGIGYRRALAARAPGWRLAFDKPPLLPVGESFANMVADAAAVALGVAYEIEEEDLAHIDFTEGVLIGNYARVAISIEPLGEHAALGPLPAFTLVASLRDDTLQPSTRYMSIVIDGAIEHGLPPDYVAWLRSVPARPEREEAARFRPLIDDVMKRR
jgi:hypothetical protein